MAIVRVVKRDKPFVTLDKTALEDRRLSWKAKGLHSYLMSKPDNWQPLPEELARMAKDGLDAVNTGLRELEAVGYLLRKKIRDPVGKIVGYERLVYETPQRDSPQVEKPQTENPQVDFPQMGLPQVDYPRMENPMLINNDLNNNEFNKELENKEHVAFATVIDAPAEKPEMGGAQQVDRAKTATDQSAPTVGITSGNGDDDEDYTPEFLEFWGKYPRRREKRKAWRCWRACLKGKAKAADLILAAERYATACDGADEHYIKLPATFLGRDRPYEEFLKGGDRGEKTGGSNARRGQFGNTAGKSRTGQKARPEPADWDSEPDRL